MQIAHPNQYELIPPDICRSLCRDLLLVFNFSH